MLDWILVPLFYPDYRRLMIRSCMLSVRLELLCTFFAVIAPFATPGLLRMVRRWLDQLRTDVTEFGRLVSMKRARAHAMLPQPRASPQVANDSVFQNPWA
jgi:hypothetical protein